MKAMQRISQSVDFPSPVGGWDTRNALSDMPIKNAVKLDNWFPTTDSVKMRRGFIEHATGMLLEVETLIEYVAVDGTGELFAANNGAIYDVTTAGDVGDPVVGGGEFGGNYDLNNISELQVQKSIASTDNSFRGMVFNNDGTKVFTIGSSIFYEWNLSTAYDLNSLSSLQATADVSSLDFAMIGIAFNNDGTKIFSIGRANDRFYEWNLSSAYDLNSISSVQASVYINPVDTSMDGIAFNNDGTKIFATGNENNRFYEWHLSTGFDLTTISSLQAFADISAVENSIIDIAFNDDGTKIFAAGSGFDKFYEWHLSTAYDLNSISSLQASADISLADDLVRGIAFNNDGSKIFAVGNQNDSFYEWNLGPPGPLLNNRWQYVQITTSAGQFLSLMNGEDTPLVYDGSTWGTTPAITGPTVANLIWNNIHQRRLWFGEIDSLDAWYLPVNNIGGTAVKFPIGGIARLGGYLMAMGTWTRDSGEGMDDVAVFVTSEGEAIVYNGIDPSAATTWKLIGVFRIGKPIGRRCMVKAGTDVIIITQDGFVPLSAILTTDRSQSRLVALSDQIAKVVNDSVRDFKDSFGWQPILYPKGTQLLFNVPQSNNEYHQYVFNTITGAPCRFIGQNALCWVLLNDNLFFGGLDGKTYKADTGLSDNGSNVSTDAIQAFSYFGNRGSKKLFKRAELIFASTGNPNASVELNTDFNIKLPTATPQASLSNAAIWGTSLWGVGIWGTDGIIFRGWRGIRGNGRAGSIRVRIKSISSNTSWISTTVNFVKGGQL